MFIRNLGYAVVTALFLGGCSSANAPNSSPPLPVTSLPQGLLTIVSAPATLNEVANLDYSNGSITVYRISKGVASEYSHFTPSSAGAQGLAMDSRGLIYTTITASNGNPCAACVEIFSAKGKLVARLLAPHLPSAQNAPFLTDLSLDVRGDVYVSDYGQQAVYFYRGPTHTNAVPAVIVENSQNAASVLATPNGNDVFVSGGCGFASVRPYARSTSGHYHPGNCFGIGTIALIGGAADNDHDILTPVDGARGVVSVSSPAGGTIFNTPDSAGSISAVALAEDGSTAYVADHRNESVYAFSRPANGWVAGGQPKLLTTYTGFKSLDIIATNP